MINIITSNLLETSCTDTRERMVRSAKEGKRSAYLLELPTHVGRETFCSRFFRTDPYLLGILARLGMLNPFDLPDLRGLAHAAPFGATLIALHAT